MWRIVRWALLALGLAALAGSCLAAEATRPDATDLYSERELLGVALSPSGQRYAELRRDGPDDVIALTDRRAGRRTEVVRIPRSGLAPHTATLLAGLNWEVEHRLGFRLQLASSVAVKEQAFTVALDGTGLQSLDRTASGSSRLAGAVAASALVASASATGAAAASAAAHPSSSQAPVPGEAPTSATRPPRFDVAVGYRELGAGPDGRRRYVLARAPGHDRVGLYLFDPASGAFGEPLAEHPRYDLTTARIAPDGSRPLYWCYVADVRGCEHADPAVDAGMQALQAQFGAATSLWPVDASSDGSTLLLRIEGPGRPPAYYVFDTRGGLAKIGAERPALEGRALPTGEVVHWRSRDGLELTGYLTVPHGASAGEPLPLVVYPHGGPEARDALEFDGFVQYFAARGYAVLQPNFRGSEGYGRRFIESGYRQWGRGMQDDISDAVDALAAAGRVDARRACIVGASYGGYAALAAVTLTPGPWRCAVAIAAIADLPEFLRWRRRSAGSDSDSYAYWRRVIGDPRRHAAQLAATSPARHADAARAPVLLIHGDRDPVVPLAQSQAMRDALLRAGRPPEWLVLEGQGHSAWSPAATRRALQAIGDFLWRELGPGVGAADPPSS